MAALILGIILGAMTYIVFITLVGQIWAVILGIVVGVMVCGAIPGLMRR